MKNIWKIDFSTYIFILLLLLSGLIKDLIAVSIIILVHELGHIFFFKLFKYKINKITIYPFGGIILVSKKIHERIYKEILSSSGGILFQLIFLLIINCLYKDGYISNYFYSLCTTYNKYIPIFNIIPLIPLDGSKILLSIFTMFFSYRTSYVLMIISGIISYIVFLLYNYLNHSYDLVIYVFLFINLIVVLKNYKYIMNIFYLERIMYDHYYNKIIYLDKFKHFRVDKYYYVGGKCEKKYLINRY